MLFRRYDQPASASQFRTGNFEFVVVDTRYLTTISISDFNEERTKELPSHSWSCRIQVSRAYSIGGSKKMTWFWIRISWIMGFRVKCPSTTYSKVRMGRNKNDTKYQKLAFSSFVRLSFRRLLVISRRTTVSRRVSSSVLSNSVHHSCIVVTSRRNRMASIFLSSSATQYSRLA